MSWLILIVLLAWAIFALRASFGRPSSKCAMKRLQSLDDDAFKVTSACAACSKGSCAGCSGMSNAPQAIIIPQQESK